MNNLLAANRMRIMKSKFFWFGMHLGLVWGTLYLIIVLRDATSPSALPYTTTTPFILMEAFTLTAVFCPFFAVSLLAPTTVTEPCVIRYWQDTAVVLFT